MTISIIAAVALNGIIGNGGKLPWRRIDVDMQHFFDTTVNNTVIMGATTFLDDLKGRSLYDRQNVVLTNNRVNEVSRYVNIEVATNPEQALGLSSEFNDVFVIGGAKIYQVFLPMVNTMYISHVLSVYEGDTYFPAIDWSEWKLESEINRDDVVHINKYVRKV
jgi:dihydrofolate reductase